MKKRQIDPFEGDFSSLKRPLVEGTIHGLRKRPLDIIEGTGFHGLRKRPLDIIEGTGFHGLKRFGSIQVIFKSGLNTF